MSGLFSLKFLNNLDRFDIDDVDGIRFQDNTVQVRVLDGDWSEVASLAEQKVYKEVRASNFDYAYRILRVSDGRAGQGRFQLDGVGPDGPCLIWDDIECLQGDGKGLFLYTRGAGNFALQWQEDGWQDERDGAVYRELALSRFKLPLASKRARPSALAGSGE